MDAERKIVAFLRSSIDLFSFLHTLYVTTEVYRLVAVWERCLHGFRYVWNDANISGMICNALKMTQGYMILEKNEIAMFDFSAIWKKYRTF